MKVIVGDKAIAEFWDRANFAAAELAKNPVMVKRKELLVPGQWFVMPPGEEGTGGPIWVVGQVSDEPEWGLCDFYGTCFSAWCRDGEFGRVWATQIWGLVSEPQAKMLLGHLGAEWFMVAGAGVELGVGAWNGGGKPVSSRLAVPSALIVRTDAEETFVPFSRADEWWGF